MGSYFCQDYDGKVSEDAMKRFAFKTPKMNITSAAAVIMAWKDVLKESQLDFMYHVDC